MKTIYFCLSNPDHANNAVYIKGLRKNGVEVVCFKPSRKNLAGHLEAVKFYRENSADCDFIMVGFDSPTLVIALWPFCRKRIIYNAILPVYERIVISRDLASPWSPKGIYCWLIDYFSFHFADMSMLETNQQVDFISRFYYVNKNKLCRAWVGVDEDSFFLEPAVSKYPDFTVLFRGAFMPEAGADIAVRSAKILENSGIRFIIIGGGLLLEKIKKLAGELKPTNLELITTHLPQKELREMMQKCHLSLGQLSGHIRLSRTVPNKAYESLALKLPYLTARNSGILELLTPDQTCLTCNPADANSLAEEIIKIKNNYPQAQKIADNGFELFKTQLTSAILAKHLLKKVMDLI